MGLRIRSLLILGLALWVVICFESRPTAQTVRDVPTALRRAVGYLSVEVPRWRREHPCYSCHNNGDGVRALMVAARRGLLDIQQINDAASWVRSPERWASNSAEGGVKDESLSRIQFSTALQALVDAGGAGRAPLERAAGLLASAQRADGAWAISATSNVGTPTGYGTPLATAMARTVLLKATGDDARAAVARTDAWFRAFQPQAVLEASSAVLGLGGARDAAAVAVRRQSLDLLKQGQARDGGWGPYTTAPTEVFDTAVAVLALQSLGQDTLLSEPVYTDAERLAAISRGLGFLLAQQSDDGSWPETTRPSGQDSYSQRVSTTAWALLALLAEP